MNTSRAGVSITWYTPVCSIDERPPLEEEREIGESRSRRATCFDADWCGTGTKTTGVAVPKRSILADSGRRCYFGAAWRAWAVDGSKPVTSFAASLLARNGRISAMGTTKVEPGTGNFST